MEFLKKSARFIVLLLLIPLCISAFRNYTKLHKAQETINKARQESETLQKEQDDLQNQLSQAESQEFVEKQLRDKLGLAKEGEVVIVLPDESELKKLVPPRQEEEQYMPEANWRKWKTLFF